MAFLAPLFLTLATLVGVPLLVHLLRRKVGRTVDFPAVRYLTRMEQEHSRDLKLRHLFLLLLRMLAVLALALAAARPIAKLAGLGHAPVSVAIVLDNSMSTGIIGNERSVFDSLRADVRGVLADLSNDDRAWIVTADGRVIGGSAPSLLASPAGSTSVLHAGLSPEMPFPYGPSFRTRPAAPCSPVSATTGKRCTATGSRRPLCLLQATTPCAVRSHSHASRWPHAARARASSVWTASAAKTRWLPAWKACL